jgi:tetratricopeptide (TPR) repeat protein
MRALWYLYDIRGWFQEAEASFGWIADQLEKHPGWQARSDPEVIVLHAYARAQQGWFCLRVGRFDEASRLLQPNLDVLREAGAHAELVDALQHAGALDRLTGNFTRSRNSFQEMHHYAVLTGDTWNATIAEGNIGLAAQALGDYELARERMATATASFCALGDSRMLAVSLHFLGGICCVLGSHDQAARYLEESLTLSREIGDRWIENMALRELGNVARAKGNQAEAAALFEGSLALARQIGEQWSILQALCRFAAATLALGDFDAARHAYLEGLAMAWEMQAVPDLMVALGGLALWAARRTPDEASLQAALTSTLFVLNHPSTTKETKDEAALLQAELMERRQPADWAKAQARSREISLEALVTGYLAPDSR